MSRLQSIVLTIAALTIAGHSFVPPWVEVYSQFLNPGRFIGGEVGSQGEAARIALTRPLGSYPLFNPPPTSRERPFVRVDYGRLILYYLATLALVVPFFVWRPRAPRKPIMEPENQE